MERLFCKHRYPDCLASPDFHSFFHLPLPYMLTVDLCPSLLLVRNTPALTTCAMVTQSEVNVFSSNESVP